MSARRAGSPAIRPFSASLPMALLRARETAMAVFRPLLAEYGLTEQQWRVLRALTAEEPLDGGALAEATFLLAPSLTRILANLETRGLIERRPADDDHRRILVTMSAGGRRLVNEIAPRSEAVYQAIEAGFGSERLRALIAELDAFTAVDILGAQV